MKYCSNCGEQLPDDVKICPNCGTSARIDKSNDSAARKGTYVGVIHKCPNCGESIPSFTSACPLCGYEIRGTKALHSVQEFASKLEGANTDDQRSLLIKNYPIPNTKEDIFEFMILASSNLDGQAPNGIFDAWQAKFEQSYEKAKLVFGTEKEFQELQEIYDKTSKKLVKERNRRKANAALEIASKLKGFIPNPIFAFTLAAVLLYTVIQLFKGALTGGFIIVDIIILIVVYRLTTVKHRNEKHGIDGTSIPLLRYPLGEFDNAYVLQAKLEQIGFTNVRMVNLRDIKIGILKKPGEIESVQVNGRPFRPVRKIPPNTSIIITYHGRPTD